MPVPPPPSVRTPRQLRPRELAAARRARRRAVRRRRLLALAIVGALGATLAAVIASGGPTTSRHSARPGTGGGAPASSGAVSTDTAPPKPSPPFAVGLTVLQLVDHTRSVQLSNGATVPRTLVTDVRYPEQRPAGGGAQPARAGGPYPLIVFGHGYDVSPSLYTGLLRAWARAGYVVAAPAFPLESPSSPDGLNETDLPHQPADMKFVISSLLAASKAPSGVLSGLIAPHEIAVAGHSDGGDTALAVAYDPRYRDRRVGAAVILSGAEIPYLSAFQIQPGGPPLLATQGTADGTNLPSATNAFYAAAPSPKYLLTLLGASHELPYSTQQPQLGVVERVSIAFLDHYLKNPSGSLQRLLAAGRVPGVATLNAHP
jgi:dienelactone hydrolase